MSICRFAVLHFFEPALSSGCLCYEMWVNKLYLNLLYRFISSIVSYLHHSCKLSQCLSTHFMIRRAHLKDRHIIRQIETVLCDAVRRDDFLALTNNNLTEQFLKLNRQSELGACHFFACSNYRKQNFTISDKYRIACS